MLKIFLQDFIKTDPKVLIRPVKGKTPAAAFQPSTPLQLKKKPVSKQTGNVISTTGICPCSRPHFLKERAVFFEQYRKGDAGYIERAS